MYPSYPTWPHAKSPTAASIRQPFGDFNRVMGRSGSNLHISLRVQTERYPGDRPRAIPFRNIPNGTSTFSFMFLCFAALLNREANSALVT